LPNTNVDLREAKMDILMRLHTSGVERTERDWQSLCESLGLRIVKIWPAEGRQEPVIEVKKIQPTQ